MKTFTSKVVYVVRTLADSNGYLFRQRYFFMTKKEAEKEFREAVKIEEKHGYMI